MHQSPVCSVVVCTKARDWQLYPTRYGVKLGLARRSSANKVAVLTTSDISCSRLLKTTGGVIATINPAIAIWRFR